MKASSLIGNRYQIGELIAEGMMGSVYRGEDVLSGKKVAIKALNKDLLGEQSTLLERFRREGEALKELNHPNIIQLIDIIEQGQEHFLIMDLFESGSLYDLLQNQPKLSIERVLEIGLDLADALTRVHRLGIIHRDLKPQNVLIADDGSPRLSDFGVAHYVHRTTLSPPGGFVGSLFYVPPEAFLGQDVDNRADIWSLGVMLFEMVAGKLPYEADTVAELVGAVLMKPLPSLKELRPGLPEDLYDLINIMLAKDRELRISSVRLVGAALEAIAEKQRFSLLVHNEATAQDMFLSNIPAQASTFIGREQEIEDLVNLITKPGCRLVTLTGPGGVGKTRLSLQVAGELHQFFNGRVFFVDLAPISVPNLVGSRIARILGIKETPSGSILESIADQLQGKRTLLILDNFEQIIEASPVISQLIAAVPQLHVFVTSREALRLYGEQEYPLSALDLPELANDESVEAISEYGAVALFLQRARAIKPSFRIDKDNAQILAEICVRLDGLPLAIELAATRIRFYSPQYLLDMLSDSLNVLTGGPRDHAERHQTLRAAIDWSYKLLSRDEKKLFARLSVFQGGRSLEAIDIVCNPNREFHTLSLLESLFNKCLVQQSAGLEGEPWFILLETIQQYACERLGESGATEEFRGEHAKYFVELSERAAPELSGPNQEVWSSRLRFEYDNLRTALTWAFSGANPVLGARLAGSLSEFWYYEGPISDGEYWIKEALLWRSELPPGTLAKVLNGAGIMAFARGDPEGGKMWNREALEIARSQRDKYNWAWALFWLSAHATTSPDEYEEGVRLCEKALALYREIDYKSGLAWTYNQLGELTRLLKDFKRARSSYENSLAVCRETGNRRREAIALLNLSYVAMYQDDFQQAEAYALEGLALLQVLRLKYHSVIGLAMLAGPIAAQGRPIRAARLLGASESIFERMSVALQSADQVEIDRFIDLTRCKLDKETFELAWSEGRAMSFEQAVDYALNSSQ